MSIFSTLFHAFHLLSSITECDHVMTRLILGSFTLLLHADSSQVILFQYLILLGNMKKIRDY